MKTLGRILGSVWMWAAGTFAWLVIGLAWFCAWAWSERKRAGSMMLCGVLAGVIGYTATVFLMQFVFVAADRIGHAAPNVTALMRAFAVR